MQNFDPYYDYEGLSKESAAELQQAVIDYYDAAANLLSASDDRERIAAASSLLKAQRELTDLAHNIHEHEIYTVPVMVHIAGQPKEEVLDGKESVVQRCSRCGSVLHVWNDSYSTLIPKTEEEIEEDGGIDEPADYFHIESYALEEVKWWDVGKRIGRGEDEDGEVTFYSLQEDESLDKHELLCVALNELFEGEINE